MLINGGCNRNEENTKKKEAFGKFAMDFGAFVPVLGEVIREGMGRWEGVGKWGAYGLCVSNSGWFSFSLFGCFGSRAKVQIHLDTPCTPLLSGLCNY